MKFSTIVWTLMTFMAHEFTNRNSRSVSVGIISISTFSVMGLWNSFVFGLITSFIKGVVVIGFVLELYLIWFKFVVLASWIPLLESFR